MIEKFIEAFKEISSPRISNAEELKAWQGKANNIVVRIYGLESIQVDQIKNVLFERYSSIHANGTTFGGGNNSNLCEKQAAEVIAGFITDLTNFGMPSEREVEKVRGINISINQHQNQTIKLRVIFESIQEEMTGKQLKEIEEVLKGNETTESKKASIVNKLKSFGSDIASNIIANILTNPNIYS